MSFTTKLVAGRSYIKQITHKLSFSHYLYSSQAVLNPPQSQDVIQLKLAKIRSDLAHEELLEMQTHEETKEIDIQLSAKENYLQRMNLIPPQIYLQKYPCLLNDRSLVDIKNLLHLLISRCGFNDLPKTLQNYPKLLEIHPNEIEISIKIFSEELKIPNHYWQYFVRVQPSIIYDTQASIAKMLFFKAILNEIGIEDERLHSIILRKCIHILQRDPKTVLQSMKEYESLGLDMKSLIECHPKAMVYSLFRIKNVVNFLQRYISDSSSVITLVIQKCPSILSANLETTLVVIQWLKEMDIFVLSEILIQAPQLLSHGNVHRFSQTLHLLKNKYNVSLNVVKENYWILLVKSESIEKRMRILMEEYQYSVAEIFSDSMIFVLKYDHRHIHRYCSQLKKEKNNQ